MDEPAPEQDTGVERMLGLPESFLIGRTAGRGDSFFDAMAQVLNATGATLEMITIDMLRCLCESVARRDDPPAWFVERVERTQSMEEYANVIRVAATEERPAAMEGRPEVEGRVLCTYYSIRLHSIEKVMADDTVTWRHYFVDANGSRPEMPDYTDHSTVHLVNRGSGFEPILRRRLPQDVPVCLTSAGILRRWQVVFSPRRSTDGNVASTCRLEGRSDQSPSGEHRDEPLDDLLRMFEGPETEAIAMRSCSTDEIRRMRFLRDVARLIRCRDAAATARPHHVLEMVIECLDGALRLRGSARSDFVMLSVVAELVPKLAEGFADRAPRGWRRRTEAVLFRLLLPLFDFRRMIVLEESLHRFRSRPLPDGRLNERGIAECRRLSTEIRVWLAAQRTRNSRREAIVQLRALMKELTDGRKGSVIQDDYLVKTETLLDGCLFWLHGIAILDAVRRYIRMGKNVQRNGGLLAAGVVERTAQVLDEFVRFVAGRESPTLPEAVADLRRLVEGYSGGPDVGFVWRNLDDIETRVARVTRIFEFGRITEWIQDLTVGDVEDVPHGRRKWTSERNLVDAMNAAVHALRRNDRPHGRPSLCVISACVEMDGIRGDVERLFDSAVMEVDATDCSPEVVAAPDWFRPCRTIGGECSRRSVVADLPPDVGSRPEDVFRAAEDDRAGHYHQTLAYLKAVLLEAERWRNTHDEAFHAVLEMLVVRALSYLRDSASPETFRTIDRLLKKSVKRTDASCRVLPEWPLLELLDHLATAATFPPSPSIEATVDRCAVLLAEEGEAILATRDILDTNGGRNFLLHALRTTPDEEANLVATMITKYHRPLKTFQKSRYWRDDIWKGDVVDALTGRNGDGTSSDTARFVWVEMWSDIFDAVVADDLTAVRRCIECGALRHRRWSEGSALHLAAVRGLEKMVSYLMSQMMDVDVRDMDGNAPLHLAAREGHAGVVNVLLRGNTRVDATNGALWTALHFAADGGHVDAVRALIDGGACLEAATDRGLTPLFLALPDSETVRTLLDRGANVNARGEANATPLHEAISGGYDASVLLLLASGANLQAIDDARSTPLHVAAANGRSDVVQALLRASAVADEIHRAIRSPLHVTTTADHTDVCDNCAAVEITDAKDGATPLHLAAGNGHADVAEILFHNGAHLEARTVCGWTPLHCAIVNDHLCVVRRLLAMGANANAIDFCQKTPLHHAALRGNVSIADALLDAGAEPKAIDYKRRTVLHLAAVQGHVEFAKRMVARGAAVDARDRKGRTALITAADRGHWQFCELLLDVGTSSDAEEVSCLLLNVTPSLWTTPLNLVRLAERLVAEAIDTAVMTLRPDAGGLHRAVQDGNCKEVSRLLETTSPDVDNGRGWMPCHVAAAQDDVDVLAILLDCGSAVNVLGRFWWTPLHVAACLGHCDTVKLLLEKGADFRAISSPTGRTALHLAANEGHTKVARMLIDEGADVDAHDDDGDTPLHLAVRRGDAETTAIFLQSEADVVATNRSLRTPLHLAAALGHDHIIRQLMDHGATVDVPDVSGRTPLHLAARLENPGIARRLLYAGAAVNASDANGWTALHDAADGGRDANVNDLLKRGAVVDAVTNGHQTALHLATLSGDLPTVRCLLGAAATVDCRDGQDWTALLLAIRCGDAAAAHLLTDAGASVNVTCRTLDNVTPLCAAICGRQVEVAELLLQSGANVNGSGTSGVSPLHCSSFVGDAAMASTLLQFGAALNAGDGQNRTALHEAAEEGHWDVVQLLLDEGANINAFSDANQTPLHVALQNGHSEILDLLLSRGADVAALFEQGLSPLHDAVRAADEPYIRVLLRHGANCNFYDEDHLMMPLHLAVLHGHAGVVQLLMDEGADVDVVDRTLATPLHWAAEANRPDLVRLLLGGGANPTVGNQYDLTPLHIASQIDESGLMVEAMLDATSDPDVSDDDYFTPLLFACRFGRIAAAAALLRRGANVNAANCRREAPIHLASAGGHFHLVRLLLYERADVNARNADGLSPLHEAAKEGHRKVAKMLVHYGADVDATAGHHRWTPLHMAVQNGHGNVAILLLRRGASVDATLRGGSTPLFLAAHKGHVELVRILLQSGAAVHGSNADRNVTHAAVHRDDNGEVLNLVLEAAQQRLGRRWRSLVDVADGNGDTPLTTAVRLGRGVASLILLEHGFRHDARDENGTTALHWAAYHGLCRVLEMISDRCSPAFVDAPDAQGYTPLHWASWRGQVEAVDVLVTHGANVERTGPLHVDAVVEDGCTPLHLAAMEGHDEIVRSLVANGANVEPLLRAGFTPLYLAVQNGHREATRELLRAGASVLAGHGISTVLHAAVASQDAKILRWLLAADVDRIAIDMPDDAGDTPLMWAAESGMIEMAALLIDSGADVLARNANDRTALHWAAANGHAEVVRLLLACRADRSAEDGFGQLPFALAMEGYQGGQNVMAYRKTIELLLK